MTARRVGATADANVMTRNAVFAFDTVRIGVAFDRAADLRWLEAFFTPWFMSQRADNGEALVRVISSGDEFAALESRTVDTTPVQCFVLDNKTVVLPGWKEGGATTCVDHDLQCVYRVEHAANGAPVRVNIVMRPGVRRGRLGLMRVVRELLTPPCPRRVLELHAAAIATPAGAVIIAGPRRAGKTTLTAHALMHGAQLIANDRVRLVCDAGTWTAHGVPTIVGVRPWTQSQFPGLDRSEPRAVHLLDDEKEEVPSDRPGARGFALSMREFAGRLGSSVAARAPVAAIVCPSVSADVPAQALIPLAAHDALPLLRSCLYGASHGMAQRKGALFRAAPADAVDFDGLMTTLVESALPVWRCHLGPGAYSTADSELLHVMGLARLTSSR